MFTPRNTTSNSFQTLSNIRLEAAGLVALADLTSIAKWTAITGTASWLDVFFLAPGMHRQQSASELNGGEYPPTAAMTTGYVFRVENQATVRYLQTMGKPGHLVNIFVEAEPSSAPHPGLGVLIKHLFSNPCMPAAFLYLLGPSATMAALVMLGLLGDWWAMGILGMLMVARLCNTIVVRRRRERGWKGALEPGVRGDLLVLVSQDRWFRIRGLVDDLKAVTSGQWLREMSGPEEFAVSLATVLVFVAAALATNVSTEGSLIILCLLLVSAGILGLCNSMATRLHMHGRIMRVEGRMKKYFRRTDLVDELVRESKRRDWAERLGMVSNPTKDGGKSALL